MSGSSLAKRPKPDNSDFLHGSVFRTLVRMAIPMSVALLINLLYNVIDRMYIGHIPDVGKLSLTGIGLVAPIVTVVAACQNFFGAGGVPLFSIALGQHDTEDASKILHNACFLLVFCGLILIIVIEAAAPQILQSIGASESTFPYALQYLRIYALGTVFVLFSLGLNPYINALGDVNTGMKTVAIGAVVNIILDPIFIFVLNMGVSGAAIASVIAQMCSALWVFIYFSRKSTIRLKFCNMRVDLHSIGKIVSLGITEFVFQITNSIVMMLYNALLLRFGGDNYVTSMTVIYSIREITNIIMFGIVGAAKPIMSFNYGAGYYDRTKQVIKYMTLLNLIYLSAVWVFIIISPEFFIRIFNNDPILIDAAVPCLRIFFMFYVFGALQVSAQSVFVSLGKAKFALFFSLLRKVFLIIPFTLILPHIFDLGVNGVFAAEPLSEFIGGTICYVTMLMTVWKELSAKI